MPLFWGVLDSPGVEGTPWPNGVGLPEVESRLSSFRRLHGCDVFRVGMQGQDVGDSQSLPALRRQRFTPLFSFFQATVHVVGL